MGIRFFLKWTARRIAHPRLTTFFFEADKRVGTDEFFPFINRRRPRTGHAATDLQIVKAVNLLVNKHEYFRFSVRKAGRPVGFMLDTVNACNLGCPTCQHSDNKEWIARSFNPLPSGTLKPDTYADFIRQVGLWSYAGSFYNNSEPFLNKRTPEYLKRANLYRVQTIISSNMSIPKLDAEAVVASGLTTLMVAIDGTTQPVYERYRRGGKLELALANISAIAKAKKKLGSTTPVLRWQFLTFEHNAHQVDDAIKLAEDLGCNLFSIATPYDVSADDPSINTVALPRAGEVIPLNPTGPFTWQQPVDDIGHEIDRALDEVFFEDKSEAHPEIGYCDWLHLAVVADAVGRIHPCCLPDYNWQDSFVFGQLPGPIFNGAGHIRARELFGGKNRPSKCAGCADRPLPQVGLGAVLGYLTDNPFDYAPVNILCGWSRHDANARALLERKSGDHSRRRAIEIVAQK